MEAVAQEESGLRRSVPQQARAPEVRSKLTFIPEQSPAANLPQDPTSFGGNPIVGNMPIFYPSMFSPTPPLMVPQVPIVVTSMGCAATMSAPPSFVGITSPNVAALKSMDDGFIASTAPKPTSNAAFTREQSSSQLSRGGKHRKTAAAHPTKNSNAAFTREQSSSQSARGRKRRKTAAAHPTKKAPSPHGTSTHSVTTSGDESSRDDQPADTPRGSQPRRNLQMLNSYRRRGGIPHVDQPLKTNEQDFEMDIEEGNELTRIKQDQYLFETVLCGESSSLYIKEEAPDPEEPPEGDIAAPTLPPTTSATCHLCSTRCSSREDLVTHFTSAHPGCVAPPGPTNDVAGGGYFKT